MLKKICKIRYFIMLSIAVTVLMSAYGIIRFHYNTLTVSNTTPIEFEGWKILFEDGSCKNIVFPANISAEKNEKERHEQKSKDKIKEQLPHSDDPLCGSCFADLFLSKSPKYGRLCRSR